MKRLTACLVFAVAASLAPRAAARPDIEFITIGAPGNMAYPGPNLYGWLPHMGRGSVSYEYRIGKYEVTTAQWIEFVNNYSVLGGQWTEFGRPNHWGGWLDPSYSGPGKRYIVNPNMPTAAMWPCYGITWREAAMFCNWLHNDKAPGVWAIMNGAYDASTFMPNPGGWPLAFKDQLTHHRGARYWIPTLDEWIKAAYYDPHRYGPGLEGWWEYPHRSNHPPVGGIPGVGQTNANFTLLPGWDELKIPLGSYPDTLSPWGALDMTGMTTEHTEFWWFEQGPYVERFPKGAGAGSSTFLYDRIHANGPSAYPSAQWGKRGLRVAAAIPSVGASGQLCAADCNGDGILTVGDFACFQGAYVLQNPIADCDDDGLFSVVDFGCFQTKFGQGCR